MIKVAKWLSFRPSFILGLSDNNYFLPMPKRRRNKTPRASATKRSRGAKNPAVIAPLNPSLLLPAQATSLTQASQPDRTSVRRQRQPFRWILAGAAAFVAIVFVLGLTTSIQALRNHGYPLSETAVRDPGARKQLRALSTKVSSFEASEQVAEVQIVPDTTLEEQLSQIQVEIEVGKHREAVAAMNKLAKQIDADRGKLTHLSLAAPGTTESDGSLNVPILVYHQTPGDFASQLDFLQQHGYHTITMAQLAAALHNQDGLPPKPVIITFDDGFADQMTAFEQLQHHHMVATYYIIDGGPGSRWCIGAGRRYNDPAQPAGGCGDAYLSWDQVRQLDRSGIITIGAHTIDHDNLASDSPTQQQYEITQGKHELEAQIGHKVSDFAYPYGSFNATTLQIVQQAGFATAVTTTPGTSQSLATIYTLRRVRDPRMLP